jgi:transcriptional regulator with XRE-family HTH domain
MMARDYIGQRIRQAREARGLSLREVAERMATSHTTIAQWEKGTRPIHFPDLGRLAKVLEQPVQFFLPDWYVDPSGLSPDLAALVARINRLPQGTVRDKAIRNFLDQLDTLSDALTK